MIPIFWESKFRIFFSNQINQFIKLGLSCAKLRTNLTCLGFILCKLPSFHKFYFKKIILNFDSQKIGIIQTLGQKIVKLKILSGKKNLVKISLKKFGQKTLQSKKNWLKKLVKKTFLSNFFLVKYILSFQKKFW